MGAYVLLGVSILLEVFGSTMLKMSNGFTKALPVLGMIAGFGSGFYLLSVTLEYLPLSLVYATWSGIGTVLTALAGVVFFNEKINKQGVMGIGLLVVGVLMMNLAN
ncbi:DMT family transporter [Virgibacillus sediminis]|uniref:DMT family transporter n=1 Tax=Virgibacillus sediminis TaxID=202260 RepID=A0ABV7A237_9BACI